MTELKLQAAHYLIKNMPYHFSQEEYFLSSQGEKYRPDISLFNGKKAVKTHCDSLLRQGYRIKKQKVYDISSLDSRFLINNIELAFEVWQKPWARNISFNDFCRYILPYRAQTEEISNLRKEIKERFLPILDSAKVNTPLEACITLQKYLKDFIKYKDTGLSLYPTIDETLVYAIWEFYYESCCIPVTIDQTHLDKWIWSCMVCCFENGKFIALILWQSSILHAQDFSENVICDRVKFIATVLTSILL